MALRSEDGAHANFHVLEDQAFGWELIVSPYLPFESPGTEICQRGNKMQQNISFSDEIQCPWDFLGRTYSRS